jgi:fluoride exporter
VQKTMKVVYWLASHQLVLLAVAGAVGTLARYWLSGFVQWVCGESFPWGTFIVNVLGCLLFGLFWTLAEERMLINSQTRFVVLTGFMGAFTTFSTFAFESAQMLSEAEWFRALGNIVLQNILGIAAIVLGFAIGRII